MWLGLDAIGISKRLPCFQMRQKGWKRLTGGGARLAGLLEVAESLLRVPARLGYPVPLSRMPDELIQPEFSTAIGMLLYTHRTSVLRAADDQGLRAKLKAIFAGSL